MPAATSQQVQHCHPAHKSLFEYHTSGTYSGVCRSLKP